MPQNIHNPAENKTKVYLLLHFTILVWGITGAMGRFISLDALSLVWYRLLIASLGLITYSLAKGYLKKVSLKHALAYLGTGAVLAFHWMAFFGSIKLGTVSIGLATLSSAAFFTSIFEPLIHKKRFNQADMLFGMGVVAGVVIIFGFETRYHLSILVGVLAAILTALFSTINGKLLESKDHELYSLTSYEMLGAWISSSIFLLILHYTGQFTADINPLNLGFSDFLWLLALGLICTDYTMLAYNYVLTKVSPFTAILNLNLEPIYGILLALLFWPEEESMSFQFYLGTALIIVTVVVNHFYHKKLKTKQAGSP